MYRYYLNDVYTCMYIDLCDILIRKNDESLTSVNLHCRSNLNLRTYYVKID